MGPEILGVMIPLSATILGITAAIFGIWTAHRQKAMKLELRHRERLAAMERGLELAPEAPDPELDPAYRRSRALLPGLIWSLTGAALAAMLYNVAGDEQAWIGGIPLAVGLGYLIFYAVEGRRLAQAG